MIVIDKSKSSQNIILTLTELTSIENAKYLLVIKNDAVRTVSNIFLGNNLSTATERFDLFKLTQPAYNQLVSGYYTYSIYQQAQDSEITDVTLLGASIEDGKLLVKSLEVTEVVAPADNNDYIIYYNG